MEYDQDNAEECKENFSEQDKPMREFHFELEDGKKTNPTCCSWLLTDSSLFVIGYETSHAVFFDHSTGNVEQSHKLDEADSSAITCIAAHHFSPQIAVGHESGLITIYDYSQKSII